MLNTDNQELPPERYDARLFNQVYKAGLKAREVEEKDKKILQRRIIIFSIVGLVVVSLLFILLKPKPTPNYIQSLKVEGHVDLNYIDPQVPEPREDISSEDLNITLTAKSSFVYDLQKDKILLEGNSDEQLPIASLTKLVTSMVLIDTYGLDTELEIMKDIPQNMEYTLGLQKGDVISTQELLEAMLVGSYNDAAYVIANEYGYDNFISLMNTKANLLGCDNTNFVNPNGLDAENHYSTTKDLSKISKAVLNYPSILQVTQLEETLVEWISEDGVQEEEINTTNWLMTLGGNIEGLKTGYTEDAGQCLITYYNDGTSRYLVILLNSEDRFTETDNILNRL